MVSFLSSASAEAAFYDAFSNGDHAAMMGVWAQTTDIICVHPLGPRLTGLQQISESWKHILGNDGTREFEIQTKTKWSGDGLVVHVVNEIISVRGGELRFAPVLATNIYKRIDGGWLMVAHHASIDASKNVEPSQTRH